MAKRIVVPSPETHPETWNGEHGAIVFEGVLVLWSVVKDDAGYMFQIHRASIRGQDSAIPEISFDSPAAKKAKRSWRKVTTSELLTFPREHRDALGKWHKGGAQ